MATLVMWVNAHPTKKYCWLEPVEKNTLLASNPFLNLANRAETEELVALLNDAFGKVSYQLEVSVDDIKPTQKGSLAVEIGLDDLLDRWVEAKKAPAGTVSEKSSARIAQIRAELAELEVSAPARKAVLSATDDPFGD